MIKISVIIFSFMFGMLIEAAPSLQCNNVNPSINPTTDHLIDNNDGTVSDHKTGLVWKKCAEGLSWESTTNSCAEAPNPNPSSSVYLSWPFINWKETLQLVVDVNSGSKGQNFGQTDWRVPNTKELFSIVEHSCWNPTANTSVFPSMVASQYWTSSAMYPDYNENDGYWNRAAWVVTFNLGTLSSYVKSGFSLVRLVRDQ